MASIDVSSQAPSICRKQKHAYAFIEQGPTAFMQNTCNKYISTLGSYLAYRSILQEPSICRVLALMGGYNICPVPLAHLQHKSCIQLGDINLMPGCKQTACMQMQSHA